MSSSRSITDLSGESVTFSGSNGTNRLASYTWDYTIRIWDADTGKPLITIHSPNDERCGTAVLCCSKDGSCLAVSHGDLIYIRNINYDGIMEDVRTINADTEESIISLCMNYDGSVVLSGHGNGHLRLWDIKSGALCCHYILGNKAIGAVDISFDGALIASGGANQMIQIHSTHDRSMEEICQLHGHTRSVSSLQFNYDASRIASCSYDKTVRIWDVASQSQVMLLEGHTDCVTSLSYSYDGTRLATGSHDKVVMIWDVETGDCLWALRGHNRKIYSVSFSHDGSRVASGGEDPMVIIWDSVSGCEVERIRHFHGVAGVCFMPVLTDFLLK